MISDSFRPFPLLKGAQTQTILASAKFRTWGKNEMQAAAVEKILQTASGIRLLGYYSPQKEIQSKGLVILLHGWEGSVDSTYIVCTGETLYRNGYNVFRLNLRDHGRSHHLNEGIFYAVLLDEIFEAVTQIAGFAGGRWRC